MWSSGCAKARPERTEGSMETVERTEPMLARGSPRETAESDGCSGCSACCASRSSSSTVAGTEQHRKRLHSSARGHLYCTQACCTWFSRVTELLQLLSLRHIKVVFVHPISGYLSSTISALDSTLMLHAPHVKLLSC